MGRVLSKFVPWEAMHERTMMAGGTHGYLAPEFVYRNEITTKSDVYSFGVLLLETISGRKPAQAVDSVGWQSIFEWATPLVQAHRYLELLDPHISSVFGNPGNWSHSESCGPCVHLHTACSLYEAENVSCCPSTAAVGSSSHGDVSKHDQLGHAILLFYCCLLLPIGY